MYADWRLNFYPKGLAQRNWLEYYARHFETVELNATTYRLPQAKSIERWLSCTPSEFRFTVKLSWLITHRRKLGDPRRFIENYFKAVAPLRPKIDVLLVQLPPFLGRDDERLATFLDMLSPDYRYAVEFREPSWYVEQTCDTLRKRGMAFVIHDLRGSLAPDVATAPFAYVRLHGPVRAYAGSYSRQRLEAWRERIRALPADDVYVYFNNDQNAYATKNAVTLRALLRKS
jgi:uncharacterized protein YecE (DUF72 family)